MPEIRKPSPRENAELKLTAIIVDDEPLAREKIRGFLEAEEDIDILAECRDGREALIKIEELNPDLVFLDVQMPEMDGFEVLDNLEQDQLPTIIFVTAYDQYALKAFEVHAVDYLLKPYDRARFRDALDRARAMFDHQNSDKMREQLLDLLKEVGEKRPKTTDRLVIKSSGRVVFLKTSDIDWVDAAGNYVRLHSKGETHQLRETMSHLEKRLDPEKFLRIHRSTIVNIECIKELQQQFHGDYVVLLHNGKRLTLSRSYRDRIQGLLGT